MVTFYDEQKHGRDVRTINWLSIEECPDCGRELDRDERVILFSSISDVELDHGEVIEQSPFKIVSKYYSLCVDCV